MSALKILSPTDSEEIDIDSTVEISINIDAAAVTLAKELALYIDDALIDTLPLQGPPETSNWATGSEDAEHTLRVDAIDTQANVIASDSVTFNVIDKSDTTHGGKKSDGVLYDISSTYTSVGHFRMTVMNLWQLVLGNLTEVAVGLITLTSIGNRAKLILGNEFESCIGLAEKLYTKSIDLTAKLTRICGSCSSVTGSEESVHGSRARTVGAQTSMAGSVTDITSTHVSNTSMEVSSTQQQVSTAAVSVTNCQALMRTVAMQTEAVSVASNNTATETRTTGSSVKSGGTAVDSTGSTVSSGMHMYN